jgi:glycerophosphoryl diester phosphodiesterase
MHRQQRPQPRQPSTTEWIAHAGLAIARPGGAPDRASLDRVLRVGPEWLEVDVLVTADQVLVLRHDSRLGSRQPVAELTLNELRRAEPELLTLDDGVEHLRGRLPLLLDIKSEATSPALGRWLARRRSGSGYAACTESAAALQAVRERAPRVARWRSLPDLGTHTAHHVTQVLAALWDLRNPSGLAHIAAQMGRGATRLVHDPHAGVAILGGVPWRRQLPAQLSRLSSEVGAAGICAHHWLVTPELVDAARQRGLVITAWTVNSATRARHMVECGVDLIVSDEPAAMRSAVTVPAADVGDALAA